MAGWVPLEANPRVLTDFARALGMPTALSFCDVWSAELLDLVPAPRHAVLLLFPLTPALRSPGTFGGVSPSIAAAGSPTKGAATLPPLFIRQTIPNACGTVALLHALLQTNLTSKFPAREGSALARLGSAMRGKTAVQCAEMLEKNSELDTVQKEFALRGQTAPPAPGEKIDLHFLCFVEKDGALYELDGRRDAPVKRGETTAANLLQDACKVVQEEFMARDPNELRFTIIALAENAEE